MSNTEMKDSGFQWIGNIPFDWDIIRLKYVSRFKTGSTPPNKVGISDVSEQSIPWYTAPDFSENFVLDETNQYISNEIVNIFKVKIFPKDTILLICIASVGKIGITKYVSYSNQQITGIMPFDIHPKYLLYLLHSQTDKIQKDASANVVPIINTQYLTNIPVTKPTLLEQKLITTFLDDKCSNIDNIINDLEKQIEILEKYKKSVITEAVTKGLNLEAEMKESGIEWMGDIPTHWNVKRLKYLGTAKNGLTYKPEDVTDEGILVLRSSNIQNNKLSFEDNVYVKIDIPNELILQKNDILICSRNGSKHLIGKNVLIDKETSGNTFGAFMCIYRSKFNLFISYVLKSSIFENYLQTFLTSTINQLTIQNLNNIKIPFTDNKEEQMQIVDYLSKKCSEIDLIIDDKKNQIETIKKYKNSLIYEYVTGKKRVSRGDVNE